MNRYKLIKEYPGSLFKNTIVYESNGEYIPENIKYVYFAKKEVENYPEFWQKLYNNLKYYEEKVQLDLLEVGISWSALKIEYPKQYWELVLQEISDESDNNKSDTQFFIYWNSFDAKYDILLTGYTNNPWVRFNSKSTAKKAIEIMGDKLDYIYKDKK